MHLTFVDPLLTYLGVRHITLIKEVWVLVVLAVFYLQLLTAWRLRVHPELWILCVYLGLSAQRDLMHFLPIWNWFLEACVGLVTLVAASSVMLLSTYCVKQYQRQYARQAIVLFALAGTGLAAFELPPPYPNYSTSVYFTRLYVNTFCSLLIANGLVYICWNWGFRMLKTWTSRHALVMVVWLALFVGTDRIVVSKDAWFLPTFVGLTIQATCLLVWVRLAKSVA